MNDTSQDEARRAALRQAADILRGAGLDRLGAELEHGCLSLKIGEPFFVLRAQDLTAEGLVREWARQNNATAPEDKIDAAMAVADAMARYAGPRKNAD